MRHILSVASNEHLLTLRNAVLESAGFRVTAAFGADAALKHLATTSFDGVLLGQTLSEEEVLELAAAAKKRAPAPRVCVLHELFGRDSPFVDGHIDVHEGPEAMIRCLKGASEDEAISASV